MAAPDTIVELVEKFTANREQYKSPQYNEEELRVQFVNRFFEALGWDVADVLHQSDVIHEARVEVVEDDGTHKPKYPDYGFRIGQQTRFFVEAKKPAVNLNTDPRPAYQLRRYGWSAKLPVSILTDFEEFVVYDCRVQPNRSDQARTARLHYYTYTDYVEKWDEIAGWFSYDAVRDGKLDELVKDDGKKTGRVEVDTAFLNEMEEWRRMLAQHIALHNQQLGWRELNAAVQTTIDRIVFLRICEDRGVEPYGRLRDLAKTTRIYANLIQSFRQADEKYNSGLFHFKPEKGRDEPDQLTLTLAIPDAPLQDIIGRLYYPISPYEFSVLPSDILGQVYERFLGKVIQIVPGEGAVVEDKPEVRKAGGVYYTPTYIVEYIVKNTVGKLVEGKTPSDVDKLRILDPACGSGSFLIGAYQYLLDWHRDWYVANELNKRLRDGTLREAGRNEYRLSTREKKRILLNNLYGVDLDQQAVEVTKLSLLLKVLEGETAETAQPRLFNDRVLPDLDDNIKWGNSLIGSDFYRDKQLTLFDNEETLRIKVFDWERGFPSIMAAGGFDAVIGNPPYIRSQSLGDAQRDYYGYTYEAATRTYDIYVLFVERAITLMDSQGVAGFILPNKFFTTDYGEGLRKILVQRKLVDKIVDFEDAQVFSQAGTYTALLFLSRNGSPHPGYAHLGQIYRDSGSIGLAKSLGTSSISFDHLALTPDGTRWTLAAGIGADLLVRLQKDNPLFSGLQPQVFQGLKTSADKIYMVIVKEKTEGSLCRAVNLLGEEIVIEHKMLKPVVKGEHVQKYLVDTSANLFIIYPYTEFPEGRAKLLNSRELENEFPNTWLYLNNHRESLGARDRGVWSKRDDWYAYARSQNIVTFLGKKFLMPYMTTKLRIAPDLGGELFFVNITTGGYGLRFNAGLHSDWYILGLLNSTLLDWCIQQMTNRFRGGYFAMNKQALERLPIRTINFDDPADRATHDRMVALVERMLDLHKQRAAASGAVKDTIQAVIDDTDQQIDALVYELYGLTDEEIAIVEGS